VAPLPLEVIEERPDHGDIEIREVESRWGLAAAALHECEQQPEGVGVRANRVGAHLALTDEALGEERLQCGSQGAHDTSPAARSRRSAASASSSGAADRYQKVAAGSTWPRYVDSHGMRASTPPPSRYQPSRVLTANECLKPWMWGRDDAESCHRPAPRRICRNAPWTVGCSSLVPRVETSRLGAAGAGQRRSRQRP